MKTCLVLGAGALADALHFRPHRMRHTRPPLDTTFFQVVQARGIALGSDLTRYLRDVIGIEPTAERLAGVRMEEIFKDAFFDLQENRADEVAHAGYVALVELYLRVLRETTNWLAPDVRRGGPVGRLIAAAADQSDEVAIITFNHDLVIENEVNRRAHLRARWCLDHGYGSVGQSLRLVAPTASAALFPLHADGGCDHTRQIRILKLHGSLNWVVRLSGSKPTANYLTGGAGSGPVLLLPTRTLTERTVFVRQGQGRTQWDTWPVVVPPVYAKQALRSAVHDAWDDARTAVTEADRVVFFGYSLPVIDVEAEKLFERALAQNDAVQWIDVIDPGAAAASRYAGLAPAFPVRWYPSLTAFLAAGA
jgi:hypothetical protein